MQSRFIHEGDIQDFAKDGHKLFHVIVDKEAKKEEDYKGIFLTNEERVRRIDFPRSYFTTTENYHHVPTIEAPIIDLDEEYVKRIALEYNYFSPTYQHGRNGEGHLVQPISDPTDLNKDVQFFPIGKTNYAELRMKGVNAHTVASGKYFNGDDKVFIKKLDGGKAMTFKQVWQNTVECVLISAIAKLYSTNMKSFRSAVVGEMRNHNIEEADCQRMFQRILDVILWIDPNITDAKGQQKSQYETTRIDVARLYRKQRHSKLENIENIQNFETIPDIRKLLKTYYTHEEQEEKVSAETVEDFVGMDYSEIMETEYPDLEWIIPDVLPQGLTGLSAKSGAGKTRLLNYIIANILHGGTVFNKYTLEKGQVLALGLEDGQEDWQARARQMGFQNMPKGQCTIITIDDWEGETLGGVLEAKIEKWLMKQPNPRLVLIDTYGTVAKKKGNKDQYAETVRELRPLRALAKKYRVCILCTHHNKKAKELYAKDNALGSTAILATADTRLIVDVEDGAVDGTVKLNISGRRVYEQNWELRMEEDSTWSLLSDKAGTPRYRNTKVETDIKKVFEELEVSERNPLQARQLTNHLGLTKKGEKLHVGTQPYQHYDNYKKKLERWYDDGKLEKYEAGKYYPNRNHSFWAPF